MLFLVPLAFLAVPAPAQNVYESVTGPKFMWYGHSAAILGDVNADGYADFAVGADYDDTAGIDAGTVFVYSGKTGALLYQSFAQQANEHFGGAMARVGDVNNDGIPDFAVGAIATVANSQHVGSVTMISGANGASLYRVNGSAFGAGNGYGFGFAVAGLGDINSDGVPDFAGGGYNYYMPFQSQNGIVAICAGQNGNIIKTIVGASQSALGTSVAGPGDANVDGVNDVAYSSEGFLSPTFFQGQVALVSGANWQPIFNLTGTSNNQFLGTNLAAAGDVNLDGAADLLVGTPNYSVNFTTVGKIESYSGPNGSLIYQNTGDSGITHIGWAISGGADVDGDGYPDYASLGVIPPKQAVRFYSGKTGNIISTKFGTGASSADYAWSINMSGDVSGDGLPDVLVASAPHYSSGDNGYIDIWSFTPAGISIFGTGTPGCFGAQTLTSTLPPKIGTPQYPFTCNRGPANSLSLLIVTDVAYFPGADPFSLGITMYNDFILSTQLWGFDMPTDIYGIGTAHADIPNDPTLVGQLFYGQVLSLFGNIPCTPSVSGLSASMGVAIKILQ
ncbi:MAG: VCBS repeat-containing protein [Planctomycetes bacterium]|nr:VCBS repeat-containing protein [Planctomycetota bacterium]